MPGTHPSGLAFNNPGQALGFYSGYATGSPYSQFLIGFDGSGNALLTVNTVGGGPTAGCNFQIAGALLPCGVPGGIGPLIPVGSTTAQINAAIQSAITGGAGGVTFQRGVYNIAKTTVGTDNQPVAILVEAPAGFVLDLNGSTLLLTGADVSSYAHMIRAENGSNFTVENGTLGYVTPPFVQATLASTTACVANANGSATFTVVTGFTSPAWANVQRILQYNPATALTTTAIIDQPNNRAYTRISGTQFSVAFNGSSDCTALGTMVVSDNYILDNEVFGADGVNILNVEGVTRDNVRVQQAAGLGFRLITGSDLQDNRIGCYVQENTAYIQSTNADCDWNDQVRGTATFESVHCVGMGDDGINVFAFLIHINSVTSVTNITLTGQPHVLVGDTLQFIDANGVLQGTATIAGITVGSNTQISLNSPGAPSGVSTSYTVYNASDAPNECTVNNGFIGQTRTRGIHLNCAKNKGSGNYVFNTGDSGFFSDYGPINNQGPVPTTIDFDQSNTLDNTNYLNISPGAAVVEGWNGAGTDTATAGQIGFVNVNPVVRTTQSSCVYVTAASLVTNAGGFCSGWNAANANPINGMTSCGLHPAGTAFCNDTTLNNGFTNYGFGANGSATQYGTAGTIGFQNPGNAQIVSGTLAKASAIALSSNTPAGDVQLTLQAGVWMISGNACFTGTGTTTVVDDIASISASLSALDLTPGKATSMVYGSGTAPYQGVDLCLPVGPYPVTLTSAASENLTVQSNFGVSTSASYGYLQAELMAR